MLERVGESVHSSGSGTVRRTPGNLVTRLGLLQREACPPGHAETNITVGAHESPPDRRASGALRDQNWRFATEASFASRRFHNTRCETGSEPQVDLADVAALLLDPVGCLGDLVGGDRIGGVDDGLAVSRAQSGGRLAVLELRGLHARVLQGPLEVVE